MCDSGGQYKYGTTDVTRTVCFTKPKESIKNIFTRVLKGHIAVATANLKKYSTGNLIDVLARKSLKQIGLDYGHGTGHGVGNFGDVHEKYPIISPRSKDILSNNNLFSIEPGHYEEGKFGLRIENLYVSKITNNNLKLKNITLAPYELNLVDLKLITSFERKYIKKYHQKIFNILQPRLSRNHKDFFTKHLINKI